MRAIPIRCLRCSKHLCVSSKAGSRELETYCDECWEAEQSQEELLNSLIKESSIGPWDDDNFVVKLRCFNERNKTAKALSILFSKEDLIPVEEGGLVKLVNTKEIDE